MRNLGRGRSFLVVQLFVWKNFFYMRSFFQVRLEALALISESKKSTQNFNTPELNLIISFLEYNLGEKLELVPFIKKVNTCTIFFL